MTSPLTSLTLTLEPTSALLALPELPQAETRVALQLVQAGTGHSPVWTNSQSVFDKDLHWKETASPLASVTLTLEPTLAPSVLPELPQAETLPAPQVVQAGTGHVPCCTKEHLLSAEASHLKSTASPVLRVTLTIESAFWSLATLPVLPQAETEVSADAQWQGAGLGVSVS